MTLGICDTQNKKQKTKNNNQLRTYRSTTLLLIGTCTPWDRHPMVTPPPPHTLPRLPVVALSNE